MARLVRWCPVLLASMSMTPAVLSVPAPLSWPAMRYSPVQCLLRLSPPRRSRMALEAQHTPAFEATAPGCCGWMSWALLRWFVSLRRLAPPILKLACWMRSWMGGLISFPRRHYDHERLIVATFVTDSRTFLIAPLMLRMWAKRPHPRQGLRNSRRTCIFTPHPAGVLQRLWAGWLTLSLPLGCVWKD